MEYIWYPIKAEKDLPKGLQMYWWTTDEGKVIKQYYSPICAKDFVLIFTAWTDIIPDPEPYKEK